MLQNIEQGTQVQMDYLITTMATSRWSEPSPAEELLASTGMKANSSPTMQSCTAQQHLMDRLHGHKMGLRLCSRMSDWN